MMKKIILLICILFVISGTAVFAQQVGDKVTKEIIFDGNKFNKQFEVNAVKEYDTKGNMIHEIILNDKEYWYEYNSNGKVIHGKWSEGDTKGSAPIEGWYEYDEHGNKIHEKWSDGLEYWNEYEYDAKGNSVHQKSKSGSEWWNEYDSAGNNIHTRASSGEEWWSEYDVKGKKTYEKWSDGSEKNPDIIETWYERDADGNLIHETNTDGYEYWYGYDFWSNGKIKRCIEYFPL